MSWTAVKYLAVQVATDTLRDWSPVNGPEFKVDNHEYRVSGLRGDMQISQAGERSSSLDVATRLFIECVSTSSEPTADVNLESQTYQIPAHVLVHGVEISTKRPRGSFSLHRSTGISPADIIQSKVIIDTDSLRKAVEVQRARSPRPETLIAAHKHIDNRSISGFQDPENVLRHKYQMYILAINERDMERRLIIYCHDVVTHNGKALPLSEYRKLMEDAQAAMADLEFSVANLIVDQNNQRIAVKLDFRGTPKGAFGGVTPAEGEGKEVKFSEIVFYWFRDGKIAEVVSLVDLDEYRKEVVGSS